MSDRGLLVRPGDELLIVTRRGKVQRIAAEDVPVQGRTTQGVRLMRVEPGDRIASVTVIRGEEVTR